MLVLNILVVDDEDSMIEILVNVINQNKNYRCDSCKTGEEAINLVEKFNYDVVITDYKLPGISGIDVLEKIKNFKPDVEVILLTGYASMDSVIQAMKFEAYDYIQKPFNPEKLLSILNKIRKIKTLVYDNNRSNNQELYIRQNEFKIKKCKDVVEYLRSKIEKVGEIIRKDMEDSKKIELIKENLNREE